jgi:hypothetical protein
MPAVQRRGSFIEFRVPKIVSHRALCGIIPAIRHELRERIGQEQITAVENEELMADVLL